MNTSRRALLALAVLPAFAGCRTVYYTAMEKVGFEKRDLLRRAVKAARGEQQDAGKQYQDALQQLQAIYGRSGSNLEKAYDKLKAEYESCAADTKAVQGRIKEMDRVASDLFREWEGEIRQMDDATLSSSSRDKLAQTKTNFANVSSALHRSYEAMPPVLKKLQDHVLYLKHNLNAEALGSLRGRAQEIEGDIQSLLTRMNAAIAEADGFVKTLK